MSCQVIWLEVNQIPGRASRNSVLGTDHSKIFLSNSTSTGNGILELSFQVLLHFSLAIILQVDI